MEHRFGPVNPARGRTVKLTHVENPCRGYAVASPSSVVTSSGTRFPASRMIYSTAASAVMSAMMTCPFASRRAGTAAAACEDLGAIVSKVAGCSPKHIGPLHGPSA